MKTWDKIQHTWNIKGLTVADAGQLAHNNISAFWEDAMWRVCYPKDMQLDFLIDQSAKRQATNLLKNRDMNRHLKAVDPATGSLVGYSRWILPASQAESDEGKDRWLEAQVPDVNPAEKETLEKLAISAWWDPRDDGSDVKNVAVMNRILSERTYIKLDYVAVHPDNQGKGIASALVERGIQYAKEAGVPIFVMAFESGRGVYARLGFREVDCVIQDASRFGVDGEYAAYFMIYHVDEPTKSLLL